jgi:hypothetical protein
MVKKVKYTYGQAETFLVYNNDPKMLPVKVYLPIPPEPKYITGYGLPPDQQFWKKPEMPVRIKNLVSYRGVSRTLEEIWEILETKAQDYKEEIQWIKLMWYYRKYGMWFYNDGVPTWITGKYFYYLFNGQVQSGSPEYRYRDRMTYIWRWFCENDTYDFCNKDEKGFAIPEPDGTYLMYDTGRRVCFGDIDAKYRRAGYTYQRAINLLETISREYKVHGGIQSRDDQDARTVFLEKLLPTWKKTHFFFKPACTSGSNPKTGLNFDLAGSRSGETLATIDTGLQSWIDYKPGKEGAYDGTELREYFEDEIGKTVKYDIHERHRITKSCLIKKAGKEITGYTSKTSTVEKMEKEGGKQFYDLAEQSKYYQRNKNGQTLSGLYRVFISTEISDVAMDKHGNPQKEKARQYILNELNAFLLSGDSIGWESFKRKFPLTWDDCFIGTSALLGFNVIKIQQRMDRLRFETLRVGNILPTGNDPFADLVFVDNPNGRFTISYDPPENQRCRKYLRNDKYYPYNPKGVIGCDPFSKNKTEGNVKRLSNGGGSGFLMRDIEIDHDKIDIHDWKTHRFVFTYNYRASTTDEYFIDMLRAAIYFEFMLDIESNIDEMIKKIGDWNYGGYLLYLYNIDGTPRNTPGTWKGEGWDVKAMNMMKNYTELHVHREMHGEILNQVLSIPSLDKITKYDLLASALHALYGVERGIFDYLIKKEEKGFDKLEIENYLPVFSYRQTA